MNNKCLLIGILAKKRHGKDTMADRLVSCFGFQKDALAGPLKNICQELFLLSDEQLYGDHKEVVDERYGVSTRQILQFVGTELFRNRMGELIPEMGSDIWVNLLRLRYLEAVKINPNVRYVVADIRMPNEIAMIRELGGVIVKVVRPDRDGEIDQHASEKIDEIDDYDHVIINDGSLKDYYSKVDDFMGELMGTTSVD